VCILVASCLHVIVLQVGYVTLLWSEQTAAFRNALYGRSFVCSTNWAFSVFLFEPFQQFSISPQILQSPSVVLALPVPNFTPFVSEADISISISIYFAFIWSIGVMTRRIWNLSIKRIRLQISYMKWSTIQLTL